MIRISFFTIRTPDSHTSCQCNLKPKGIVVFVVHSKIQLLLNDDICYLPKKIAVEDMRNQS